MRPSKKSWRALALYASVLLRVSKLFEHAAWLSIRCTNLSTAIRKQMIDRAAEAVNEMKRRNQANAQPAFEPPVVTPIGNLNDLLSHVCAHSDEEPPS